VHSLLVLTHALSAYVVWYNCTHTHTLTLALLLQQFALVLDGAVFVECGDTCEHFVTGSLNRDVEVCTTGKFATAEKLWFNDDCGTKVALIDQQQLVLSCADALTAQGQPLRERALQRALTGSAWLSTSADVALLASELQVQWLARGESAPTEPGTFFLVLHGALTVRGNSALQRDFCIQMPPQHEGEAVEPLDVYHNGSWRYTMHAGGSLGLQLLCANTELD
jgi:hypothetical protein